MKKLVTFLFAAATALAAAAAVAPAPPTGLKLQRYSGSEDIGLSWTLPTKYDNGLWFPSGTAVSNVKVYRNSNVIALLDGSATSFTDRFATPDYPDGFSYGLNVYEVSVCVGGQWSACCLPEQIQIGEQIAKTFLPWEPKLKNLNPDDFLYDWRGSDDSWVPSDVGMLFVTNGATATDGWLIGPGDRPLDLLPRRTYLAEFKVTSDANVLYTAGLTNLGDRSFLQVIAGNCLATPEGTLQQVKFVYEPRLDGKPFWPEYVNFAIDACVPAGCGEVHLVLTELKLTEIGTASAPAVTASAPVVTDIEVYNLQGVRLGTADSLDLQGYAPGLYAVRYRSGADICSAKILVK